MRRKSPGSPAWSGRLRAHEGTRLETLAATLLFTLLTVVMTWPQARDIVSHAREHHDVFFNLWRLQWIAHALATKPLALFDGNIFYPELRTLTFSDAILLEGLIGAPMLWLGVRPVLVHNLLLLGALVASAVGMFVLVRHLTGCRAGAIAAGVIFAFVPYRFEHYMHLELQWTVWIPWTFWAMHRTIETGAWRHGLLTGAFLALQVLSSIYYGVFLAVLLALVGGLLLIESRAAWSVRVVRAFAAGALLAGAVTAMYLVPYRATNAKLGGRSTQEITMFSARPSSYLVATPDNRIWGRSFAGRGRPERRLFPGALAVFLAVVGLLLRRPTAVVLVYLAGAVITFELSLGLSGYSFRLLYDHVPVFRGFRALARLGIFVVFFLGVLAAFGYAALSAGTRPIVRRTLAGLVIGVLLLEYSVRPLALAPYPNEPPPLHAWLAAQPRGVVAELPMPAAGALPGLDPRSSYLSTFHWHPLVNGYSGFYPPSYLDRLETMRHFPNDRSIARLRRDTVRYLVIHIDRYSPGHGDLIVHTLQHRHGFLLAGRFDSGAGEAVVFLLR